MISQSKKGRAGVTNGERHSGCFNVVHVKHANGNSFATWLSNIFVISRGNKPWISLPQGKGIHLTIAEEKNKRLMAKPHLTIAEEKNKRLMAKPHLTIAEEKNKRLMAKPSSG
ncbi:40S ribosomal protein S4, X isoform [Saguinus oedipus]|uniref:40S ribosomal protein S4, X isoform n=1 Tax=Saguinus oedipus TaxID=9490 RepID=A0ABQ9TDT5_SAGOE|nr:40S ribosomal protein S4, X isoform [Saguinus oedipus]